MNLHAIETRYRGYRFRSRLEARWAVFLDHLGVAWRYESEGFKLSDGTFYLPDFYLPVLRQWIEIKPETPSGEEVRVARQLSQDAGARVLMICGDPWPEQYSLHMFWPGAELTEDPHPVEDPGPAYEWADCRRCAGVGYYAEDYGQGSWFCRCDCGGKNWCCACNGERWKGTVPGGKRITAALQAAREARFEHGES